MVTIPAFINENALIAEQLAHYVTAVSGVKPVLLEGFPFYLDDGHGVLIGIDGKTNITAPVVAAVQRAIETSGLRKLTVLAAAKPPQAPDEATPSEDSHWLLDLPAQPGQKTRNMLRKAEKSLNLEMTACEKALTQEHLEIVRDFTAYKKKSLDEGTCFIFQRLPNYVNSSPGVTVFSASSSKRLEGFIIADFTAFNWAYYMFAFRRADSVPGTADFLLQGLLSQAQKLGYEKLNLGLGINRGVMFFKQKWGAKPTLKHVETNWNIPSRKSSLAKLAARFFRKK